MSRVLILLVGTNPLPIWVSWLHLWKKTQAGENHFDRVALVCSSRKTHGGGTEEIAERLSANMRQLCADEHWRAPAITSYAIEDVAAAAEIHRQVLLAAGDADIVHLNFTGGTKAMAVYAFDALNKRPGFEHSYLDAHSFRLRFGDGTRSDDLRPDVPIRIERLLSLHGMQKRRPLPTTTPKWPITAEIIYQEFMRRPDTTRTWCRKLDSPKDNDPVEWLTGDLAATFTAESHLNIGDPIEIARVRRFNPLPNEVGAFLGGKWLESIILGHLRAVAPELDAIANLSASLPNAIQFEVDVVGLSGYQLLLFSCATTTFRDSLKQKGFEAAHRAAQLGGEEARSVLVTTMPPITTTDVERDLRSDLGGALVPRVIGIEELRTLPESLKALLEEFR